MVKQADSIKVELRTYPNGRQYWTVRVGDSGIIGCVDIDGSAYRAAGHRKSVPSLMEAAKQVVRRRIRMMTTKVSAYSAALEAAKIHMCEASRTVHARMGNFL